MLLVSPGRTMDFSLERPPCVSARQCLDSEGFRSSAEQMSRMLTALISSLTGARSALPAEWRVMRAQKVQ